MAEERFPGEHTQWPEEDWASFMVIEGPKEVKIATFRHKADNPSAVCIMINGLLSNAWSWAHVAKKLAEHGIECVACDYRWYGKSTGRTDHFYNVDILEDDHAKFFQIVRAQYPDLPLFIMAHSLGCSITLRLSAMFPDWIRGLLLYTPFIQFLDSLSASPCIKKIAYALKPIIMTLNSPAGHENSSFRIQEAYEYMMQQPSYSIPLRMGTIIAMAESVDKVFALMGMGVINTPMMIIRAGKDQVVDNNAIDTLLKLVSTSDKVILDYPEAWHAITRDPDIWDIIEQSISWIKQRLQSTQHHLIDSPLSKPSQLGDSPATTHVMFDVESQPSKRSQNEVIPLMDEIS